METRNLADMTDLEIVGHLQNMRTDLMHSRSIFERGELLVLIGACCDTLAGGMSFVEPCRSLFTAARGGDESVIGDLRSLDLHMVPSRSMKEVTGEEMIAFAREAARAGTIAVFMFHGVGGGHNLNVQRQAHQELIAYISEHKRDFWVGTFAEATDWVRAERERLGWPD